MSKELPLSYVSKIQSNPELFQVGDYFVSNGIKWVIQSVDFVRDRIVPTGKVPKKTKRKVSYDELIDFVNNYPYKLVRDVYGVCDPPLVTYNDFSLGDWPDSVVAQFHAYSDNPDDYYYAPPEEHKYYIYDVDESECYEKVSGHHEVKIMADKVFNINELYKS